MIILDINYFKTKNLIKKDDCSCAESIAYIRARYGSKDLDAVQIYEDVLAAEDVPDRWKMDTILYRTEFNSLKAYVDMYKRSEIVETNQYRVMLEGTGITFGTLEDCLSKINEMANIDYNNIEKPIDVVGYKERKVAGNMIYTYSKYQADYQIPINIKLQLTSYDGLDVMRIENKAALNEALLNMKSLILERIKKKYVLERRYTDETDWYDCWVKV